LKPEDIAPVQTSCRNVQPTRPVIQGTPKWLLTLVWAGAIIDSEDRLRGARPNANAEVDRERQDN